MEIKTVSFIGLGALGILFGNHLSKRMPSENLRFIADKERIARYKKEQVYCNGECCQFNYITPEEIIEPADLVIFTVKYNGLKDAIQAVKNQVGENTIILSLLNGIISEAKIGQTYGMDNILYSVAQGMDAVKVGNELTYKNMGMICFGENEPDVFSSKTQRVDHFFTKMELPHVVDKDMKKRLWGKFMLNVGTNQTVAVYESNYGAIQKEGPLRDIVVSAMRETMMLSEKEGVFLTEEDLQYWLSVLDALNSEGKPSMAQDMEAKRYSEVDLFAGAVIELGKQFGVPTPVNKDLYNKVKSIESKYN